MKLSAKTLSVLLAASLGLGLLAGCNSGTPSPTPSAEPSPEASAPVGGNEGTSGGKLVAYSPATEGQINAIIPLFEEKTGIEVEVITGGTGELLARVDAEGDNPYADVIFGGGESSYSEYKHIFQDYVSPENENVIDEFKNTLGYCTNYCLDSSIFIINTDLVGDIEINGYKDLLNPELKGKIAMPDPTASSSAMMHIETLLSDYGGLSLENEEGWDIVRQLVANLDGKLASGSSAAWKSVADGEMVVALSYEEAGIILSRDGAPVKVVYPEEGTVFTGSTVGVVKNCKNLENAQRFVDFLLSQDVQNIFCNDLDVRPVRDDVSYPEYFRPATDVKTVTFDQSYVNEHKQEITEKYMDAYMDVYPG